MATIITATTANEKQFTVAGVARKHGVMHVRFANDTNRGKALAKDGQTDIRLVQLPEPMYKADVVALLKDLEMFQDDDAQIAFAEFGKIKVAAPGSRAGFIANSTGEKLFQYAGVACKKGIHHARFANTADRVKALLKDGQTDVRLIALPEPMTKYDAVMFMMPLDEYADIDAQRAFDDFLGTRPAPMAIIPTVAKAVIPEVVEEEDEEEEEDLPEDELEPEVEDNDDEDHEDEDEFAYDEDAMIDM